MHPRSCRYSGISHPTPEPSLVTTRLAKNCIQACPPDAMSIMLCPEQLFGQPGSQSKDLPKAPEFTSGGTKIKPIGEAGQPSASFRPPSLPGHSDHPHTQGKLPQSILLHLFRADIISQSRLSSAQGESVNLYHPCCFSMENQSPAWTLVLGLNTSPACSPGADGCL